MKVGNGAGRKPVVQQCMRCSAGACGRCFWGLCVSESDNWVTASIGSYHPYRWGSCSEWTYRQSCLSPGSDQLNIVLQQCDLGTARWRNGQLAASINVNGVWSGFNSFYFPQRVYTELLTELLSLRFYLKFDVKQHFLGTSVFNKSIDCRRAFSLRSGCILDAL